MKQVISQPLLSRWWWTIDRFTFFAILSLMGIGALLVATASPSVAERIDLDSFYFIERQVAFIGIALIIVFGCSFLSPTVVSRAGIAGLIICLALLVLVLFIGMEAKGAKRWIYILGFSLQPSEFTKPFFVVASAWILSRPKQKVSLHPFLSSTIVYVVTVGLIILQPDFGMVVTISLLWGALIFLAGLPILWISLGICLGVIGVFLAYTLLPHVAERINNFLDPSAENYQVRKSLEAFNHGGLIGTGPGEGSVKQSLPDSHTDFIFAVAGEELGLIFTLVILSLFAFITVRSILRIRNEQDQFTIFAVVGLALQICIQAFINVGVTIKLLPTKGMTLPFISYGGSSLLAISVTAGLLLALSRKRFGSPMLHR